VFEGSADNIIGILYVKDVFRRIARGDRQLALRQFLRPAVFVPETKKVDALLREMQKDKSTSRSSSTNTAAPPAS
jgi:CBS domain containing-hemolysin-like protein